MRKTKFFLSRDRLAVVFTPILCAGLAGGVFVEAVGVAVGAATSVGAVCNFEAMHAGTILVADHGANALIAVDANTGDQCVVSSGGHLRTPTGVALEADGTVLMTAALTPAVIRVRLDTGGQTLLASGPPMRVAVDVDVAPTGEVFVADQHADDSRGALIRIDPTTGIQTVVRGGIAPLGFGGPTGLDATAEGTVFIAVPRAFGVHGPGAIYEIDSITGAVISQHTGPLLEFPTDVVLSEDGYLYVTTYTAPTETNSKVVRIDRTTGAQTVLAFDGFLREPQKLAVDINGQLIIGDPDRHSPAGNDGGIVRVDPSTGTQALVSSSGLLVDPFGVVAIRDTTPPAVAPDVEGTLGNQGWYRSDVAVRWSVSDPESVVTSTDCETEAVTVDTAGRIFRCEATSAGGTTTESVTIRRDLTPPTITLLHPQATTYVLNQIVNAEYLCSDSTSGVAMCIAAVPSGHAIDTSAPGNQQFAVSASDNAGNTANAATSYAVRYGICSLYDPVRAVKPGAVIPIKIQLCDASGANMSSPTIAVVATGLSFVSTTTTADVQDGGNANPDGNFRFDPDLNGYIFNLKTTGLASGTWVLHYIAGSDASTHVAQFRIR